MTALSASRSRASEASAPLRTCLSGRLMCSSAPTGQASRTSSASSSLLQAIRAGRLQDYVARAGGADRILHFGAKVTERAVIDVRFGDGYPQYEIELDATDDDRMSPSEEVCIPGKTDSFSNANTTEFEYAW